MSEQKSETSDFDPMAMWKQFQDMGLKVWAQTMSEMVTSEDFAKAMGQSASEYLESAGPVRQQIEKIMEQYLQQMNLPTRNEVITLAERLTSLEMRMDDIDAKLDEVLDRLQAVQGALTADVSSE